MWPDLSKRRHKLPAPVLIGRRPSHKPLANHQRVLEKGCVHMRLLELQAISVFVHAHACVCVLDRWAGDSDRLVCL